MSLEYRLSTAAPRAKVTWTSTRCTSGAHSPRSSPRCSRLRLPARPSQCHGGLPQSIGARACAEVCVWSRSCVVLVCMSVHVWTPRIHAEPCLLMPACVHSCLWIHALLRTQACAQPHSIAPHGRARARCSHVGKRQHCGTLAQRIAPEVSRQSAARDRRVPRDAAPSAD